MPAKAKVWCWKVKVTYRCGCDITGDTIHNCDSYKSNCSAWITYKTYNRECANCMLKEQSGRYLSDKADSSSNMESIVEGTSVIAGAGQAGETMKAVYYTESARKVSSA
ncbi:hypothetical protein CONLIGDRAFT_678859 [Coniochaeta ligniaria NRRL 30616]|uniref:Uncharacterized protein n=1 Tax=Coniochaeta ligniaria NRRL 30616 TaxID=1408157 RepID=A0A1J7JGH9_9PEZI|nr:hypothetical protein CONLIGDRAFT_678859 [Coniochaeta ligniaria NRRL 30616]